MEAVGRTLTFAFENEKVESNSTVIDAYFGGKDIKDN